MASAGVSHGGPARADPEAAKRRVTTHGDHVPRQSHFWRHFIEMVIAMVVGMAVGMVAWMRYRGQGWRTTAEMTLAMCAATAAALGMFWLHIVSEGPPVGVMHALMLPAMLIAMLSRREEYAHAHR